MSVRAKIESGSTQLTGPSVASDGKCYYVDNTDEDGNNYFIVASYDADLLE